MIHKPTPKKRKGKFNKKNLKLLKAHGGKEISRPSGTSISDDLLHEIGWELIEKFYFMKVLLKCV